MNFPAAKLASHGLPAGVILMMAADSLDGLQTRMQNLLDECDAIESKMTLDGEGDTATEADYEKLEANAAEIEKLGPRIAALKKLQAARVGPGRKSSPENLNAAGNGAPMNRLLKDPNWGFNPNYAFGDYAQAIARASRKEMPVVDERLINIRNAAASTFGSEGSGPDGGYAVPPEARSAIMERAFGQDSLYARTDRQISSSNTITFPMDMTTPWGSTGINFTWEGESNALTQSKVALENVTMRLHKGSVLVPVTDELLEDAPALNGYLARKVPEKIDFGLSLAFTLGTGVGKPLGFMNAPCLVTQAAEGGQTIDTINASNVAKMWARMPSSSLATAVWLIHPDSFAQLPLMSIANQPIFLPPGGFSNSPFGTLLGRPVIPHQVCASIGDLGDIIFADMGQYMTVAKAGGMKSDTSIHLWFDQNLTAFRFTIRIAGQPWWSASIASRVGTFTQSPFIVLAAR